MAHRHAVEAGEEVEEVYRQFQAHGVDYMAVLEGGNVSGVCSRRGVGFLLGSQFGFAIYHRRPVRRYMEKQWMRVVRGEPLRRVLERALSRTGPEFDADVVLAGEDGGYLGMIPAQRLVATQSRLLDEQFQRLDQQRIELERVNQELFRSVSDLRRAQSRYETLLGNVPLGVALLDASGFVRAANEHLRTLLGMEIGPGGLRQLAGVVIAEQREEFGRLLERHASREGHSETGAGEFVCEVPGRGRRRIRVRTRWVPETSQICACLEDVTEFHEMERRLAQREKHQLLETLVGGIAHEINNKLLPISGYAELLIAEAGSGGTAGSHASRIASSASEAARIVRSLLQLSRPPKQERSVWDMRQVAEDAVGIVGYRARRESVEMRLDLAPGAAWVLGDADQIKQVLINLLVNSLDAMHGAEKRALGMRVSREGAQVVVRVSDTGHGVPPEIARRIFDPFFTTKDPDRGTGLGLAVCFSIASQHGGEIVLEKTGGDGAVFRLSLPGADAGEGGRGGGRAAGSRGETAPGPAPERRAGRVLLVDDEEVVVQLLAQVLEAQCGYRVTTAGDGEAAWQLLEAGEFDLLVTDIRMPVLDGIALAERVQACKPGMAKRILFITGDEGRGRDGHQVESLGIPVLRKPFPLEDLISACDRLIREAGGA